MTAQTEARASLWAPATADQSVSGWTYDFDQIERISRAAYNSTGYDATMEVVQFVMAEADRRYTTALAAKDAEIAALKKEAADVVRPFADKANAYDGIPPPRYFGDTDFAHTYSGDHHATIEVRYLRAARSFLDKWEGRDG